MASRTVTSKDGTTIAFDQMGEGPALILVGGALSERSSWGPYAKLLAPSFTVYSYDRRGRGDSGVTAPYAIEREFEDLDAVINQAGGSAFVHGQSSGAVLSLESANKLPGRVTKLSLYEPPFIIDDGRPLPPSDYVQHLEALVAEDRRGEAIEYWMGKVVLAPPEVLTELKASPAWPSMEALAHTLPYDVAVLDGNMAGRPLPFAKWAATPPTLVLDGGASPEWIRRSAKALADGLPDAHHTSLEGQAHSAKPEVLVPQLERFFLG